MEWYASLEWPFILLGTFGGLLLLLVTGLPVAVAFMIVNVAGVYIFWGGTVGIGQLSLSMKESVGSFVLLPIPLFIVLGEVLFHSGMAARAIDVVDAWLGRMPGRLGLLAVGSGVVISTLSGSGIASTAMLGATLVPDMEKRGYKTPMSVGPVMASGGIAMIIPPSGDIILLASLAHLSVGTLLMAGVFPGVLMAALYAAYIITRSYLQPSIAPPYEVPHISLPNKIKATILNMVPVAIIIFLVTGVIFVGIATPSEAAAMGALGAFLLAATYRRLSWKVIKVAVSGAGRVTVMLLAILLGAMAFGQVLSYSGAAKGLVQLATHVALHPIIVVIAMQFVVLALGCFMDEVAIIMMVIPIYMPIVHGLGIDPSWFIILLLINMEIGLTTPPFGLILFVMQGTVPDKNITDIYKAAAPFLICTLVAMALVMAFPMIAMWLPGLMK